MNFNGLHNGLKEGNYLTHTNGLINNDFTVSLPYCNEAISLFNNMTVQPTLKRKAIINKTILYLKNNGQWDNLDYLYMSAAHDSQAALLNWKNPGTFTLSPQTSPTWTIDQGTTGNNTTNGYYKTGWNASVNGVNYTLNSCSVGVYVRRCLESTTNNIMGAGNTGITQLGCALQIWTSGYRCSLNGSAIAPTESTTGQTGLYVSRRINSTTIIDSLKGVDFVSQTSNSNSLSSIEHYLMMYNNNGTLSNTSRNQISAYFVGSGTINPAFINEAIENIYLQGIGALN